jgi:tRNA 2-thiouridine synthesizing protein A
VSDELTVDAIGLRCPLPVIRLAAAAKQARPGTVVTVLSTDPAAEPDVQAWCRLRGHALLEQEWLEKPAGRTLRSRVRLG